jgi:hypothetical protein
VDEGSKEVKESNERKRLMGDSDGAVEPAAKKQKTEVMLN